MQNYLSQSQYEKIWRASSIGSAIADRGGNFLKVNPVLCEMLQYSEGELLQKKFSDITHPADLADDQNMVDRVLLGEIKEYRMTKRYITKTGPAVWATLVVTALENGEGEFQFFFSQIFPVPTPVSTSVSIDKKNSVITAKVDSKQENIWQKVKGWVLRNLAWIIASMVAITVWSFDRVHEYKTDRNRISELERQLQDKQDSLDQLLVEWKNFRDDLENN